MSPTAHQPPLTNHHGSLTVLDPSQAQDTNRITHMPNHKSKGPTLDSTYTDAIPRGSTAPIPVPVKWHVPLHGCCPSRDTQSDLYVSDGLTCCLSVVPMMVGPMGAGVDARMVGCLHGAPVERRADACRGMPEECLGTMGGRGTTNGAWHRSYIT
jgi:hypothetical protein